MNSDVTRSPDTDDDGRECPRCGLIWCVLHPESPFFGQDLSRADANLGDCTVHEWGPVERARLTGNPHRRCHVCDVVTLDLDDDMADDNREATMTEREALEGMVYQFGHYSDGAFHTGGLSALEDAFDVLGWDDPHPSPAHACDEPGCGRAVSAGTPTPSGYRRTCYEHRPTDQT